MNIKYVIKDLRSQCYYGKYYSTYTRSNQDNWYNNPYDYHVVFFHSLKEANDLIKDYNSKYGHSYLYLVSLNEFRNSL